MSAEDRRAALVEAAFRVVARHGVQAATTRAICSEAGMPQGVFHYCFASKNALLHALIDVAVRDLVTASDAALGVRADDTPGAAVSELLQAWWTEARRHPERQLALYELTLTALRDPELSPLAQGQYRTYFDEVGHSLQAMATSLGMDWSLPVRTVSRMFLSAFDGLVLGWLSDPDDDAVSSVLAALSSSFASFLVMRDPRVHSGLA